MPVPAPSALQRSDPVRRKPVLHRNLTLLHDDSFDAPKDWVGWLCDCSYHSMCVPLPDVVPFNIAARPMSWRAARASACICRGRGWMDRAEQARAKPLACTLHSMLCPVNVMMEGSRVKSWCQEMKLHSAWNLALIQRRLHDTLGGCSIRDTERWSNARGWR
jgi:hypothetical protein